MPQLLCGKLTLVYIVAFCVNSLHPETRLRLVQYDFAVSADAVIVQYGIYMWQSRVENVHYSVSMKIEFNTDKYASGHCLRGF